jgi:predicted permease
MNPPALTLPAEQVGQLYDRILEKARAIPGVAAATYALYTPMESNNYQGTFQIAGYRPPDGRLPNSSWNRVGPDYFEMLGTRVTRGRAFTARDMRPDSRVAIISETLANRYFQGQDPIGARMGRGSAAHASDLEIVGVVEDVKYSGAGLPARPMYFLPGMQWIEYETEAMMSTQARFMPARALVVRLNGPASTLQAAMRSALASVHPDFSVTRVVRMPEQVAANFRINRMLARLTTAYGLLALSLAILGVYGVTAYGVTQRTREIGVRIALGADRARVVRGVLRDALTPAAIGVAIGGLAAFFAATLVGSFLYQIDPRDPFVIGAACLVLVLSAGAAAALPARRAASINPTEALRG